MARGGVCLRVNSCRGGHVCWRGVQVVGGGGERVPGGLFREEVGVRNMSGRRGWQPSVTCGGIPSSANECCKVCLASD